MFRRMAFLVALVALAFPSSALAAPRNLSLWIDLSYTTGNDVVTIVSTRVSGRTSDAKAAFLSIQCVQTGSIGGIRWTDPKATIGHNPFTPSRYLNCKPGSTFYAQAYPSGASSDYPPVSDLLVGVIP